MILTLSLLRITLKTPNMHPNNDNNNNNNIQPKSFIDNKANYKPPFRINFTSKNYSVKALFTLFLLIKTKRLLF